MLKVFSQISRTSCVIALIQIAAFSQPAIDVVPADPIRIPFVIDSNSATFWRGGRLHVYSSTGDPMLSVFDSQFQHLSTEPVSINRKDHFPMWIESVWQATDGPLYAWYHHERIGVCPNSNLNVPEIGALVSYDGGRTFQDLGIVLSSGEAVNCAAQNGYFAGGHGDFSVILDRRTGYFYFLFGSYDGDLSRQGIAIARMLAGNIANPVGAVWKYSDGAWLEPGIGGRVTPIFPAVVSWADANTDSLWGPSIHWNTYLEQYVVLMNRSCCATRWPQEGVYLTTNAELDRPASWTSPRRILAHDDWYPWVLGTGEGETSSEAGQRVRLFVRQTSEWEILFRKESEATAPADPAPANPAPAEPPTTEPAPAEPPPSEGPASTQGSTAPPDPGEP
jgi:hypothetical protein